MSLQQAHYPKDLARLVLKELTARKLRAPSEEQLGAVMEALYFASLKTEEAKSVACNLVWLDPGNPDPQPPDSPAYDRWSFVPLGIPLRLEVGTLAKLGKSTSQRASSYVVYPDRQGELHLWGLIDHADPLQEFMHYHDAAKPERPGVFQATIHGPGHIAVYHEYEKIAELKGSALVSVQHDILNLGPVREKLQPAIDKYIQSVRSWLPEEAWDSRDDWEEFLEDEWIQVLCRLLLRIQALGHGGAVLITPDTSEEGLNVQFRLEYWRLRQALQRRASVQISLETAEDKVLIDYLEPKEESIPADLYLDERLNVGYLAASDRELDGTIWFSALLSRADGLVLFDPQLEVKGFGVEITFASHPSHIWIASDVWGGAAALRRMDYKHFGTRHRSMVRYCMNVPGAVGFVISQDGEIRAITEVQGKVVLWENPRLRLDEFVLA